MPSNERIGRALNSNNLRSDSQHSDIDIVGALAFTSQLGAALQALYSAGHQIELPRTIELLARTMIRSARRKRIGISLEDARLVSKQALLEWHVRICRFCNGTGAKIASYTIDAENSQITDGNSCSHCTGTGELVPAWSWRAQSMFGSAHADQDPEWWEKRIDLAREIAEDAYRAAGRRVTTQLAE